MNREEILEQLTNHFQDITASYRLGDQINKCLTIDFIQRSGAPSVSVPINNDAEITKQNLIKAVLDEYDRQHKPTSQIG